MDSLEMAHLMAERDQEEVKLRAIPLVLKGEANVWFNSLAPPSKATWPTLYGVFLNKLYEQSMEDNGIQDREAIDGFHLIVVPELRTQIVELQTQQGTNWPEFKKALKEEYFLEDSQHVTKQSFMKWINQMNKRSLRMRAAAGV
ncbi:hypothetical protein L7F22_038401 [Adiantum nelumboides]|nr:hypothetical protein [Adiantum nelumboides]